VREWRRSGWELGRRLLISLFRVGEEMGEGETEGEGSGWSAGSVRLPTRGGERQTVAHGAAAPTGGDGGSGETEEEENPGGPVLG
jgi:hypothetical protein